MTSRCHIRIWDHQESTHQAWISSPKRNLHQLFPRNNQIILSIPDTEKETTHQRMRSQFQIISCNHWLSQTLKTNTISRCHTKTSDHQRYTFQAWTSLLRRVLMVKNLQMVWTETLHRHSQITLNTLDTVKVIIHLLMRSQFQIISYNH